MALGDTQKSGVPHRQAEAALPKSYGQYCPLALASEILTERWTLLVISRLIDGCRRFNDIHRGVPRMSASLLSHRLQFLEEVGLVRREKPKGARGYDYLLTEAGRELEPMIEMLAVWGQRWARDMEVDDLDPGFLAWSMHMRLDTKAMPKGRTVMEFEFTDAPSDCRRFWLIHDRGVVDMCLKHPGYEVDIKVMSDLRRFVEAWRGFRSMRREIATGKIRIEGPSKLARALPDWLLLSSLAPHHRLRTGRERTLATALHVEGTDS
jgi:DNA-binding HxlR family transcriptional regulator